MSNVSSLFGKSLIFVRRPVFLNVQCIIFCRINWHWLAASLATQLPFHFKKDIRCITFFGNTCQWDKTFKQNIGFNYWGAYILEDVFPIWIFAAGRNWHWVVSNLHLTSYSCKTQFWEMSSSWKWNIVLHFVICPGILLFSAFTKVSE